MANTTRSTPPATPCRSSTRPSATSACWWTSFPPPRWPHATASDRHEFAARFDGFSIGSNDLTQLTLGVDRDSEMLASLFDERDPAVVDSIERLIRSAHAHDRKVGLCGQRPSDDPDFAGLLVRAGIDSISVSPDSFLQVKEHIATAEAQLRRS